MDGTALGGFVLQTVPRGTARTPGPHSAAWLLLLLAKYTRKPREVEAPLIVNASNEWPLEVLPTMRG